MILVTGGAGFIGANFILQWLKHRDEAVLNLDVMTYAGNPAPLGDTSVFTGILLEKLNIDKFAAIS